VVVTYNGGTSLSDIKIYINCFESSNDLSSGSYSGMSDTNANLYVGRRGDTSNYQFD